MNEIYQREGQRHPWEQRDRDPEAPVPAGR